MTGRTVNLTATSWHCPPQRSPSAPCRFGSRCAVGCLDPACAVATKSSLGASSRGSSPRDLRVRTSHFEGARVRQPSCLIAETSSFACSPRSEFAFSIRTRMIVEPGGDGVARMGGVRSPLWGIRWEALPGQITPKGHASRRRIVETVCVWQFRLPPGTFIDAARLCNAFPPERRYVPSGGPPTRGPLEAFSA